MLLSRLIRSVLRAPDGVLLYMDHYPDGVLLYPTSTWTTSLGEWSGWFFPWAIGDSGIKPDP